MTMRDEHQRDIDSQSGLSDPDELEGEGKGDALVSLSDTELQTDTWVNQRGGDSPPIDPQVLIDEPKTEGEVWIRSRFSPRRLDAARRLKMMYNMIHFGDPDVLGDIHLALLSSPGANGEARQEFIDALTGQQRRGAVVRTEALAKETARRGGLFSMFRRRP